MRDGRELSAPSRNRQSWPGRAAIEFSFNRRKNCTVVASRHKEIPCDRTNPFRRRLYAKSHRYALPPPPNSSTSLPSLFHSYPLLFVPIFSLARLRGIVGCCSFLIKTGLIWTVRGSRSNQPACDSGCAIESISEKGGERMICFSEKECRQNRTKQRLHVFQLERNRKSRYL